MPGVAIAVVLALVIAAVATSGSDDKKTKKTSSRSQSQASGPGEIFLEPIAEVGVDPFTQSAAAPTPSSTIAPGTPVTLGSPPSSGAPVPTAPQFGTATTDANGGGTPTITGRRGGTPGLYGGTRDQSSCNKQQLIDFLQANPAKAAAWAGVQGINPTEIPEFVNGLTAVNLRSDTRVTNHGFKRGRATPKQSVLQAGTAVLVDRFGEPRVRCACGNPLLSPRAVPTTPSYQGKKWPGFEPTNVTVIVKSTTVINIITIIDLRTGVPFGRPTGPQAGPDVPLSPQGGQGGQQPPTTGLTIPPDIRAGTGDVQVTLLWQGPADLDLFVWDPSDFKLTYSTARIPAKSPSGGQLDVDANVGCSAGGRTTHVENIYWPTGGAPRGNYRAAVRNYNACGATDFTYELRITVDNRVVYNRTGTVAVSATSPEVPFTR